MARIGIIGSAGRGNDADRMTKHLYKLMKRAVVDTIKTQSEELKFTAKPILISGASAWADHIAVDLHDESGCLLRLHMPVGQKERARLIELHDEFSKVTGKTSKTDLLRAINGGAVVKKYKTFAERNTGLAADATSLLIALTWGDDTPSSSGTLDTWNKSKLPAERKIHISLTQLLKN